MEAVHVLSRDVSALVRGRELLKVLLSADVPWVRATQAFAAGDLGRAADICGEIGAFAEEARPGAGLRRR